MLKSFINFMRRLFKKDDYIAVNYEGAWSIKNEGRDGLKI